MGAYRDDVACAVKFLSFGDFAEVTRFACLLIMLAAFSGKRNGSVWRPSVRLSHLSFQP